MMIAFNEHRVCTLAQRMGLRLVRTTDESEQPLYRLVEPLSMSPVLPGTPSDGAELAELADWLQMPWD